MAPISQVTVTESAPNTDWPLVLLTWFYGFIGLTPNPSKPSGTAYYGNQHVSFARALMFLVFLSVPLK